MKVINLMQKLQKLIHDKPALQYVDVFFSDMSELDSVTVEAVNGQEAPGLYLNEEELDLENNTDIDDWGLNYDKESEV